MARILAPRRLESSQLAGSSRRIDPVGESFVLPGPSWLPLVAAFGTAAFFLLLTVKWLWTGHAFGLIAVGCTIAWLWQTDRLPDASDATIG